MGTILTIFFIVEWLVVFGAAIIFTDPFLYWTHRKGYPGPGWKFLVTLPLWLGAFGTMAVLIYALLLANDAYELAPAMLLLPFVLFLIPAAAGVGGSFLVLKLLPKRKMRNAAAHRSRIPYAAIGYIGLGVVGIMVIMSLFYGSLYDSIRLVGMGLAFSGSMLYLHRRANTPTVEEALAQDRRLPVLYLRSFDQEGNRFAEVPYSEAKKYSDITSYANNQGTYNLTLEQFFGREINRSMGPFIALGNPTDYLQPEGAYRSYTSDAGWQDYFKGLSERASAILMQLGNSDNLGWELVSLRERGLHNKLFVLTPPAAKVGGFSTTRFFTRLTDRIKGIQPASWDKFAANLTKAGYLPPAEHPGPGAVVAFDDLRRGVRLVSEAKTPEEYLRPVRDRLGFVPEGPRVDLSKGRPIFRDSAG